MYGTTKSGGSSGGEGTVFSVPITGGSPTTLATFFSAGYPYGGLTLLGSTLYGATPSELYSLPIAGGTPRLLASEGSYGDLTVSGSMLYGTQMGSGVQDEVFALSIPGGVTTILTTFNGSDGAYVYAGVIASGNTLFGTTDGDGTHNKGTVYSLPIQGGNPTVLESFPSSGGGYYPYTSGLVMDAAGNLYGTTSNGGAGGTIYKLAAPPVLTLVGTNYLESGGSDVLDVWAGTNNIGSPTSVYQMSQYAGISDSGTSGNDTLTVDFTFGDPSASFEPGITFDMNGVAGGTDSLVVINGGSAGTYSVSPGEIMASGTGFTNTPILYSSTSSVSVHLNDGSIGLSLAGGTAVSMIAYAGIGGDPHPISVLSNLSLASGSRLTFGSLNSNRALLELSTISSWLGQLDLSSNDLLVNGSSAALSAVNTQIASGYNSGTWTGQGITSSSAAADTSYLTALGVIQNNQSGSALFTSTNLFDGIIPGAGDILVKHTYYGDTNLDGKVDGSDYSRIDNGYLNHLTGWFNGDFNYDGVIDGSDYTLIDNAYNTQGPSLAAEIASLPPASTAVAPPARRASVFAPPQAASPADAILPGTPLSSEGVIFETDGGDLLSRKKSHRN